MTRKQTCNHIHNRVKVSFIDKHSTLLAIIFFKNKLMLNTTFSKCLQLDGKKVHCSH